MGTTPCFLYVSWVNILCALRFMSAECNHCREKWVGPATWYMFPRLWRMQGSVQAHSWKVYMLSRPRAQKEERVTVGRGENRGGPLRKGANTAEGSGNEIYLVVTGGEKGKGEVDFLVHINCWWCQEWRWPCGRQSQDSLYLSLWLLAWVRISNSGSVSKELTLDILLQLTGQVPCTFGT